MSAEAALGVAIKPFRVLSLDGGGMRGTYTASYLHRVAADHAARRGIDAIDIGAAFDLIVGTSTGGMIACSLAAGVPLSKVVTLYSKYGSSIFPRPVPSGIWGAVADIVLRPSAVRRGTNCLRNALAELFGGKTLGQLYNERGIALAIPAVEMSQHRGWVFKTPHFKGTNHRDDKYTLVDVCMATTAAPIFRSLAAITHPDTGGPGFNVFVDGGLWANNPVLVALVEALELTQAGQEIHVFCLGTCPLPAGKQIPRDGLDWGLAGWKFGADAANLAVDAQQFTFDHIARKLASHVDRRCSIIRFPSDKVPAALIPYLGLDETRQMAVDALINQARTDADMTNSKCANRSDPEANLICSLFESAPKFSSPLYSRYEARKLDHGAV